MAKKIELNYEPHPRCPSCGHKLRYEDYEDMWWCDPCYTVYYPPEVGVEDNPKAGIWQIGKKD